MRREGGFLVRRHVTQGEGEGGRERDRERKAMAAEKEMSLGAEKERGAVVDGSGLRTAETLLRVVPMGLCLAALVVMLKDVQSTADFGSVSYSDLTGFRYLVYANGVCAVYSLFSAFYTAMPRPPTIRRVWAIYFLDQVLTYIVLGAGAVSVEIIYLAYNGDDKVTWSQECGVFGGFCRKATASVGITFGAVACYVVLSLMSSYRLFSTYDAPIPFLGSGVEIAAFPG